MQVFLEKVILPILVAFTVGIILVNPFKFDRSLQVSAIVVILVLAYFIARIIARISSGNSAKFGRGSRILCLVIGVIASVYFTAHTAYFKGANVAPKEVKATESRTAANRTNGPPQIPAAAQPHADGPSVRTHRRQE
jgi:Na+/H+-translocating membrane pyrophosphatase